MMKTQLLLFVAVCSYSTVILCQDDSDSEIQDRYIAKIQQAIREANISETEDVTLCNPELNYHFPCDTSKPASFQPSRNVNVLTPWDIDIIAAMGDSVTNGVGAGACTLLMDIKAYWWLSWSIGGHDDLTKVSTLPNIIRKYNNKVKGFSVKGQKELNVAISGATARRFVNEAEEVVMKIKEYYANDPDALDKEWKLITLWIGGNDLCATCDGTPEENAKVYVDEIEAALIYLRDNLNRTYINLVEIIDVTKLTDIEGLVCATMHKVLCSCGTKARSKELVSDTSRMYNKYLMNLMLRNRNEFDREDFAVVLQPFFRDTEVPKLPNGKTDKSYFAPDCFHFSQKGHGLGAKYLWNNMLEPAGKKTHKIDWNDIQDYKCISPDIPYFTTGNSGSKNVLSADSAGNDIQQQKSSENILPILTVIGVSLVVMAVITVMVGMICLRKKKTSEVNLEKMELLSKPKH